MRALIPPDYAGLTQGAEARALICKRGRVRRLSAHDSFVHAALLATEALERLLLRCAASPHSRALPPPPRLSA
eukprot:362276-Pleurochrysis_carterae.AAC.3